MKIVENKRKRIHCGSDESQQAQTHGNLGVQLEGLCCWCQTGWPSYPDGIISTNNSGTIDQVG